LCRDDVAQRLLQIVDNPDLIDQAQLNACGPAVFLREWGCRDPVGLAQFAIDLFNNGQASIGSHLIKPGGDLIGQDYYKLVTQFGSKKIRMPKSADWMMMSSLRDGENVALDFEGTPDDDVSAITMPSTVTTWLQSTGSYSNVQDDTNVWFTKGVDHAVALQPNKNNDVIMFINTKLLGDTEINFPLTLTPNHYIALKGPVTKIGSNQDQVSFKYWSWGQDGQINLPISDFEKYYYGAITATSSK
jgi:hypothetical protein